MDRKFQVFVSSTYNDLVEHRAEATRAILKMGHFPVGMELFHASNESSWELIQRRIQESDYYIVIIAHRYGSVHEASGLSYTELEFEYASELGKPIMALLIADDAPWPEMHRDRTPEAGQKLASFKERLLRARNVSFWRTKDDVFKDIAIGLPHQIASHPSDGWVRGHQGQSEVAPELARLSQENERLRTRIEEIESEDVVLRDATTFHALYERTFFFWLPGRESPVHVPPIIAFVAGTVRAVQGWPESEIRPAMAKVIERIAQCSVDGADVSMQASGREDALEWFYVVRAYFLSLRLIRLNYDRSGESVQNPEAHIYWEMTEFGMRTHTARLLEGVDRQ